ncbi:MAG: hypothetical protein Fur0037_25390 [Planctomycetota bacterium]
MTDVGELMTERPSTCRPDDVLARAAGILWERDCGIVPVVGEGDLLVGVITDRDCCMASWSTGRPLSELRVDRAMAKNLAVCRATDAVEEAESRMAEFRVRRIPVVDGQGRLRGILSIKDLVRHAAALPEGAERRSREKALLALLAAIGDGRQQAGVEQPAGDAQASAPAAQPVPPTVLEAAPRRARGGESRRKGSAKSRR